MKKIIMLTILISLRGFADQDIAVGYDMIHNKPCSIVFSGDVKIKFFKDKELNENNYEELINKKSDFRICSNLIDNQNESKYLNLNEFPCDELYNEEESDSKDYTYTSKKKNSLVRIGNKIITHSIFKRKLTSIKKSIPNEFQTLVIKYEGISDQSRDDIYSLNVSLEITKGKLKNKYKCENLKFL